MTILIALAIIGALIWLILWLIGVALDMSEDLE